MDLEAGEGENPNRVVDNLDDLDRDFCRTLDELIALYKRIMIRAYQLKDSVDKH